jgi:pimeloyl-ACP methyl ester carboxylesterase
VTVMLAHTVEGSGPPLLLLNGGVMSLRAWDGVAARLAPSTTVVRCDLRGQLLSPGEPPDTLDGHAGDLVDLLDYLELEAVHVAGTSFGALVGLTLAATRPSRVRSLIAMTATDRVTPDMWQGALAVAEACRAAASGGDGGVVFDLLVPGTFSPSFRTRFAAELTARRQVIAALPREWFTRLEAMLRSLGGLDLRPLLGHVACPALVLAAGRDETFPLSHSQALAAGLPHARLRIVPGASHALVLEQPDVVVESILEFVGALESPSVAPPDQLEPGVKGRT